MCITGGVFSRSWQRTVEYGANALAIGGARVMILHFGKILELSLNSFAGRFYFYNFLFNLFK
jgi:hypothetical protein